MAFAIDAGAVNQFALKFGSKFQNLVAVVGDVEVNSPTEILRLENLRVQFDFNTTVTHRANVHGHRAVAVRYGNRLIIEHVFGGAVVEVDRTVDAAVGEGIDHGSPDNFSQVRSLFPL